MALISSKKTLISSRKTLISSRKEQKWQISLARILRKGQSFGEVGILKQIYHVIPIYSFGRPWRTSASIRLLTSLLMKDAGIIR